MNLEDKIECMNYLKSHKDVAVVISEILDNHCPPHMEDEDCDFECTDCWRRNIAQVVGEPIVEKVEIDPTECPRCGSVETERCESDLSNELRLCNGCGSKYVVAYKIYPQSSDVVKRLYSNIPGGKSRYAKVEEE